MRKINIGCGDFVGLSSDILHRGGTFIFEAHGSSMVPFIRDGDILTIQPVEFSALRIGDIVVYKREANRAIAHRIVKKTSKGGQRELLIRGDSSGCDDGWVKLVQVLGRVIYAQRGEKVLRLDGRFRHRMAKFWIKIHPFGPLLIQLAIIVRKHLFAVTKRK
jgi:signal peptidase I